MDRALLAAASTGGALAEVTQLHLLGAVDSIHYPYKGVSSSTSSTTTTITRITRTTTVAPRKTATRAVIILACNLMRGISIFAVVPAVVAVPVLLQLLLQPVTMGDNHHCPLKSQTLV